MSHRQLAHGYRTASRQLHADWRFARQWPAAAVQQQRHAHGSSPAPQATATDPADIVLRKAFAHCVRNVR